MSLGADPQITLRDYFTRYSGIQHILIANIYEDQMEFYVYPKEKSMKEGMHFVVGSDGKIKENGQWT